MFGGGILISQSPTPDCALCPPEKRSERAYFIQRLKCCQLVAGHTKCSQINETALGHISNEITELLKQFVWVLMWFC